MLQAKSLIKAVLDHSAFRAVLSALMEKGAEVALSGLTRTAKAVAVAGLAEELRRPVVVLTSENEASEVLRRAVSTFLSWFGGPAGKGAVSTLPAFDCSPYEGRSPHAEILERRAETLWNIARGRTSIVFAPLPAALGRFREKAFYASLGLELKTGDEVDLEDLVEHLKSVGYEPSEPVMEVGQFSLRGGIIDVFSPAGEWPLRFEFFGDQIESLREFDPASQRSRKTVSSALLLPLAEAARSQKFFDGLVRILAEQTGKKTSREPEWIPEYSGPFPGWEFFIPLVEPHPHGLFNLFDQPIVVWDEPLDRKDQLRRHLEALNAAYDEVRDIEPRRPRPEEVFLTEREFSELLEPLSQLGLKELSVEEREEIDSIPAATRIERAATTPRPMPFFLPSQPAPKFQGGVKPLVEDLRGRLQRQEQIVFVVPTSGKADRLKEILKEYEVPFETEKPEQTEAEAIPAPEARAPVARIAMGEIEEGVVFPEQRLILFSDRDLFGGFEWGGRGRRERGSISSFVSDLSDLKVGDYVVHVDHGIGLYQGLKQLEVNGTPRDFMLLTYQDDAKLYVPLERLDLVEKYRRSGEGPRPALDRLGGATWERTKSRVKRALRDMAQELLQLYAERKMRGGRATSADTPWQKEFEDSFEYEETPDQITALAEIKRDLESSEPMDRLLCGDVGYGKTELAMRAAFKVVQDARQVALLAPTTVLAFQHYTTFRQRLAAFPVRVEMLSRFRSAAEQKKVIADLEAGKVDIVIGTHRLLSKDIRFRDLGLLIVDEEQRFGVAAKEKLKKLRANVDVLTMSATPIPRTLHMSLGGLRDLSVIETPPRGRLAIQTVVAPFSQGLIQSAILQELERQGQVFFVHNRVESIFSVAALVQRLVPTARIGVAHGQMSESELEKIMLKFMRGEYDVLVATSLIENGLDIPRANTIIVNRADRFGLADLYQLRGRVGRSDRRAYAFFLINEEESLTPTAKRRLAALKEFSDLGAGFRLAALDLELRGAGNLLGAEQHGQLNAVGIDLYLKMLEETVEELKGAPAKVEVRTSVNLGLDIKIPDAYIADENQRLRMYKRISSLRTADERAELEAELVDRYGAIPASVVNLLDYALLKSRAEALLVQSIEKKGHEILLRFHGLAPVDGKKLTEFIRRHPQATFRPEGLLRFQADGGPKGLVANIENVLQELRAGH